LKSTLPAGLFVSGLALAFLSGGARAETAAADTPPPQSVSLDADAAGSAALSDNAGASPRASGRQASAGADFSLLERACLDGPWYWGWGVRSEIYSFHGGSNFPLRRLQDVAGQFSLEYFRGSEAVAYLMLRPGLYFEDRPGAACWDIPVECATGVPLTGGLEGALGVSDGRLYRAPTPVIGLIWRISSDLSLEAVYPEPALVLSLGKDQELRLAGDLSGGGFATDPAPRRTRLEYYSYRVGLAYGRKFGRGLKLSASAGIELDRVFDFYRDSRRIEADRAPYVQLSLEF